MIDEIEEELHRRQHEYGQALVGNLEDARHLHRDSEKLGSRAALPTEIQESVASLTRLAEQVETQVASYLIEVSERETEQA